MNDGVVPVIGDGGGVAYGMQEWMVSSNVWSATTEVSCGDGERRPETETASVSTVRAQRCKNRTIPSFRRGA
jgi:hypothetical protein